jgi:prepilin-type N-terminal cleavage/methylation domain-containing protein
MLLFSHRHAFTLIELLIVIAVIAILSIVVVLTLNPAEMLRQSRDQNRLSDMDTLAHALSLYQIDQGITSNAGSLGNLNTVYVSLPDPNATTTAGSNCASLGLPLLPAGYAYHCAGPNYYRNTNGQGWIPVNFSTITTGSPLGQLPIDPTNASSSRLYYTYTTNGTQYEVTTSLESQKYKLGGTNDVISTDGGTLASVYEKGSKFGLEPLDYGDPSLIGLWTFDEGTGTVAYDYSGSNATGSWQGTATGTSGYYSAGRVGSWAGTFDGSTNYVAVSKITLDNNPSWTVSLWADAPTNQLNNEGGLWSLDSNHDLQYAGGSAYIILYWGTTLVQTSTANNQWNLWTATRNGNIFSLYKNGILAGSNSTSTTSAVSSFSIGTQGGSRYIGLIDDVRIYNRALSAAEVAALYNGGK